MQWILGHAQLTTTQIYTSAPTGEVVASILAHYTRRTQQLPGPPAPAPGYRPGSLNVLFGED